MPSVCRYEERRFDWLGLGKGCFLFIYWLIFGYFAVGAAFSGGRVYRWDRKADYYLVLGAVLIAAVVGFRYEVGADWIPYKFMFSFAGYADFDDLFAMGDVGYQILNWVVRRLGMDLWLVNLICASVFSWGLFQFVRIQHNPWLAFLVAVPYLVIVVAMGYTRQGVAIGVLMAGLAALARDGSVIRFAFYVGAAALFHKTAVIALPLVLIGGQRNNLINMLIGVAMFVLLYDFFLANAVEGFIRGYVDTKYSSAGAAVRVAMCALPAVIYLATKKRFPFGSHEAMIWRNYSFVALGLVVFLAVSPSSTMVDRLALYILPLQIAVLSALPKAFPAERLLTIMVIGFAFSVEFVWLNFGRFSSAWVPYSFYPIF